MKKITFIRHGKSSWKHNLPDKERPLKKRGVQDALLVGEKLKIINYNPEKVYSSPANRAFSTCKLITKSLNILDKQITVSPDLYDFSGNQVLDFIKKLDNQINNVMLFGHNFAFTSLANNLGNKYIDNLPTTGLVMIKFKINLWQEITTGETELIIFPRELKTN